jgi:trigger factor
MNVAVEELGSCRKKLTIQIPVEDVNTEYQKVMQELRRSVTIPGFRKGKASVSTIKRRFKREITEEVKEKLLESSFKDALVEHNISPVGNPDVDVKNIKVVENKPLEYHAEVECIPSVEIANYKNVEIPKPSEIGEIPEEQVAQALESLQRQNAVNEPINDETHVIVENDSVTINYRRTLDGEPFGEPVENYTFWLGVEPVLPEFTRNLLGKKAGEHVDFSIDYPEDYEDKNFAGKSMQFSVDVIDVENVVLPEIDDEFAKDFEEDSLEALKEKIRKDITERREREIVATTKNNILEKIAEAYDFEIPPSLVKEQKKRNPEREENDIIKMLRAGIILAKIRDQEKLEVTDEEVEERVAQIAQQYQVTPEVMKGFLEQQGGGLGQIRSDIGETKTLDFLYEHAKFVEEA